MKAKKAKEYVFTDLLAMQSYCQSHYAEYYSKSNFSCNVTQLSQGELVTSSICALITNVHLEVFKSNQTLLYEEDANQNSVAFCWIDDPDQLEPSNTIIGGLNTLNGSIGSSWGKYSELCSSTACMLDKNILMETLQVCNASIAIDNLLNNRVY